MIMKIYLFLLLLIIAVCPGVADNPTQKDVFSVRIASEHWVQSHILKGMTRADVLKLVGKPTLEETGSTGAWIMSYVLPPPPYPATQENAYAGFEVSLQGGKVIELDMVFGSSKPYPGPQRKSGTGTINDSK
jgi:hypothetical protein